MNKLLAAATVAVFFLFDVAFAAGRVTDKSFRRGSRFACGLGCAIWVSRQKM